MDDPFLPETWRRAVEMQIDSLRDQMESLEEKFVEMVTGMRKATDDLEQRIQLNAMRTETIERNTSEVVEILRDWKGAMSVLKFTSKIIAPIGVIATAAAAIVGLLKVFGVF